MKEKSVAKNKDCSPAVSEQEMILDLIRRGKFKGDYILPPATKPNPFFEEAIRRKKEARKAEE